MLPTLVRRLAQSAKEPAAARAPLTAAAKLPQTRRVWPPDFKELSPQQQLRFEKKYKRRILLASRSPRWEKGVKFVQLGTVAAALVWLIFYSEFEWWGQEYKPSEKMRRHAAHLFGILDPDKRYEWRKDAPVASTTPTAGPESGSKSK